MPPTASLLLIHYFLALATVNLVITIPTANEYAERLGAGRLCHGTKEEENWNAEVDSVDSFSWFVPTVSVLPLKFSNLRLLTRFCKRAKNMDVSFSGNLRFAGLMIGCLPILGIAGNLVNQKLFSCCLVGKGIRGFAQVCLLEIADKW